MFDSNATNRSTILCKSPEPPLSYLHFARINGCKEVFFKNMYRFMEVGYKSHIWNWSNPGAPFFFNTVSTLFGKISCNCFKESSEIELQASWRTYQSSSDVGWLLLHSLSRWCYTAGNNFQMLLICYKFLGLPLLHLHATCPVS